MKTIELVENGIKGVISNKGTWYKVSIVHSYLSSDNNAPEGYYDTGILTFDKYFSTEDDANNFIKSKEFKSIYNSILKLKYFSK